MLKIAVTESLEEGAQSLADDLIHNEIVDAADGRAADEAVSPGDMAVRALVRTAEAFPVGVGFGLAAPLGSAGAALRHARRLSSEQAREEVQVQHTLTGTVMLEGLQQVSSSAKLKQTAPDVQQEIIRAQVQGSGFEAAYVDTVAALQQEQGAEDLEAVARAAGISDEELSETIAREGLLYVPVEKYAQSAASPALLEAVSFSPEADSIARMKMNARALTDAMEKAQKDAVRARTQAVHAIVNAWFPEAPVHADEKEKLRRDVEREMAIAAITQDPDSPAHGWRLLYDMFTAERDALLHPALDALARGMGNGVDILQNGPDGRGIRVSNNAPWYQEYYKENGKAPNQEQLRDLAYLLTVGDVSAPKVEGWMPSSQEAADAMEAARGQLDELNAHIGTLSNIKDRMMQLDAAEVRATQGLTPEAYGVYHAVMAKLREIGGVQAQAARLNALLFAARADAVARVMREKGGKKDYTARDYFDGFVLRYGGRGETGGGFAQREMQSQKEAVRKQYEGTAQWMKAPNGKVTNLTEDQWLTVRTPAFKAWFGDWEVSNALEFALHGDPVTSLTGKEFQPDGVKLTDKVPQWYKAHFNGVATNPELGEVKLDLEGVKDSMGHGMGREKAAAYAAVPYIIKHGVVYDRQTNWKQRGYDTAVIIAPIKFAGQDYIGEVVVKRQPNRQGFYLHEVEIQKKLESAFKTPTKGGAPQASRLIIADHLEKVKDCSKVVDENGEPLVVYHGTPLGGFDTFKRQQNYFTSMKWYADRYQDESTSSNFVPDKHENPGEKMTYAVFLNIKKPFDTRNSKERKIFEKEFYRQWGYGAPLSDKGLPDWTDGDDLQEFFEENGYDYDGLLLDEGGIPDNHGGVISRGISYVTFEPNQIKSVDNNGTFSADDMNIFHQRAWHGSPQDAVSAEMAAVRKRYEGTPQWMMAPNGKPTNLSEEEWLAVRTPSFKAAFGDWEQVATQRALQESEALPISEELFALEGKELRQAAQEIYRSKFQEGGHPISIMTRDGRRVVFGMRGFKEIRRHSADALVLQIVPHLREIVENGCYLFSRDVEKDNNSKADNTKAFHYYATKVAVEGRAYYVRFVVREYANQALYYDHDLTTVEAVEKDADFSANPVAKTGGEKPTPSVNHSITQWWKGVNEITLAGDVDENGEPLPSVLSSRHNQEQQRAIYGEFSKENGKKIITLFAGANPSTMLHEMGHLFLDDLDELAQFDEASAKDLATVNEWAEWHEGAAKEYENTPWAQEFREHEAAIRDALKSGDAIALRAARNRWRHERFARGFELYLYEGKAPSKALRGVFRRFKQLLRRIYQFVKDVGGKPSPEVEAVMARMIASEEEIKAAELDERWRPVEKMGGKEALDDLLGDDVADTYAKWLEEARRDAEDILRARVMKDLKKEARKEFKARVEAERERKRVQLENEPVYLAEAAIRAQGDERAALLFFPSMEAYKEERAKRKSPEEELQDAMEVFAKGLDEELMTAALSDENIARAMNSPESYHRRVAIEREALRAKERLARYVGGAPKEEAAAPAQEERTGKEAEGTQESQTGKEEKARADKEGARRAEEKEERRKEQRRKEKESRRTQEERRRAYEEAAFQNARYLRAEARRLLAESPISESCNPEFFRRKERSHARAAARATARGRWDEAPAAKDAQALAAACAYEAAKNASKVDALAKGRMAGAQVFGTKRSHTKARSEGDVYRVVKNKGFEQYVCARYGRPVYDYLKQWTVDVWAIPADGSDAAMDALSRAIAAFRRNSTMAIMGWRMWPVLENGLEFTI